MNAAEPTLEGFDGVLESLSRDSRIAPNSPEWVRESIFAASEKVRALKYIRRHLPSDGQPTRILDVGGQIGAFALYASQLGFAVKAVDYAFFTGIYGRILADHGIDYPTCDVGSEPLPFADGSFDAVTYLDVIELHSFSPKRVLQEIYRVLAPGGIVIVSTPNHASIYNRVQLLFGCSVNDNFHHYFDGNADAPTYPGHHREYIRSELKSALELTGFRVEECRVVEEYLRSLILYLRLRPGWRERMRQAQTILVRSLGNIWSSLRLPFGRVLWAVGRKPAATSRQQP